MTERRNLTRRQIPWRVVLLLLVVWGALTVRLDAQWFGRDGNGAWVSAAVRNYYRYGPGDMGLMMTRNYGPVGDGGYNFYVHHPPLLVWVVAAASVPFGFNEAAARWVPIAATLISIAAFYALMRRLTADKNRAWWATAFYALNPMLLIFARIPSHEALALLMIMLYLLALTRWLARPTRQGWLALLALALIGMWTSWATILHLGVLTLYGVWRAAGRHRIAIFMVGVASLLALAGLLLYYQSQWDGAVDELLHTFLWRSSNAELRAGSQSFTVGDYVRQVTSHLLWYLTPSLLALGLAGIVPSLRRDPPRLRRLLVLLLGINGVYLLLLRNATYVHEFEKIYFLIPFAITASGALLAGWQAVKYRRWLRPALVGLLAAWLIVTGVVTAWNHTHADVPVLTVAGESYTLTDISLFLAANSAPTDLLIGPNASLTSAIAYHAERNIRWGMSPQEALALAAEAEAPPIVYFWCHPAPLPEVLAALPAQVDGPCTFVRLR